MANEKLERGIGYASIGFGVLAAASPSAFLKLYGLGQGDPTSRVFVRMWGLRNTVLGALNLMVKDKDDRRTLLQVTTAMSALDAVSIAGATGAPAGSRVMGALSTAGFVAAEAAALRDA